MRVSEGGRKPGAAHKSQKEEKAVHEGQKEDERYEQHVSQKEEGQAHASQKEEEGWEQHTRVRRRKKAQCSWSPPQWARWGAGGGWTLGGRGGGRGRGPSTGVIQAILQECPGGCRQGWTETSRLRRSLDLAPRFLPSITRRTERCWW